MYKKSIILCAIIFSMVIIISGCSNSLKDKNSKLTEEISSMKQKNVGLQKSVEELKEEIKNLNIKLEELEGKNVFISEKVFKNGIYPIYSAGVNTYAKEIYFATYIPENLSLNDKLDALAKVLSAIYFDDLPIEVSEITEVSGKKIVIINLKESEENQKIINTLQFKGQSWAKNHFQGSTGGNNTSICLIETFLQSDYEGKWIDGVKFLYNNEIINFDHVPRLGEVSYRK